MIVLFFFFFQAEDGIRDVAVTGVQTCALPIWPSCRSDTRAREAAQALADPARRGPRAGAARLRVPREPARHPVAARRATGARLRARHARGRAARPRDAPREGRRRELLGVVVLSRLLRGGAGARAELARLP